MTRYISIFIHVVLAWFLVFISYPSHASPARRTLTRTEDFVVMTGEDVPGLLGAEAADLRLYSCRAGTCKPVPFQVDKIDSNGIYVFPVDRFRDPGRDGSLLDENDEMVFMAEDAGDSMPASWKPESAQRGVEIQLRDPLDGARAWVYLFNDPGTDPPEVPDYVEHFVEGDYNFIRSSRFTLGYKTGRVDYDHMQMKGVSGEKGPDVLDKQRVGLMARLARYDLRINIPEGIIKTRDTAVIDGPVRVIIEQMIFVNMADISFQYGSNYFMRYYRCGQNNSVYFRFPSALNKLFKSLVFYWSLDFTPDIIGSSYIDPNHPRPVPISKQVVEEVPGDDEHYWWALYGKNGAILQGLDLDDDFAPYFQCNGLWRQDPEAKDKRGEYPGRIEIGLECEEVGSLPEKKDFHWFNYILIPENPSLAGIRNLENIFENPIQIAVENLE